MPQPVPNPTPDLTRAIKECLEEKGTLGKIQCQIRSEIVSALKTDPAEKDTSSGGGGDISADNFLINELLREYLDWNGYSHARDVLRAESGQPRLGLDRKELERNLGLECGPNAGKVPLLYSVVADLKRRKNEL